ncbi:uncharacterized protein MONOS_3642 [Monocercomonoides exilis]|uniref:uncharacterized protein n=1 Tax=Monocercomonoides exilis TaxID=2049356 RepID=UPI00355A27CD|nr:hypothetical protein MONOS_3642 [Monocercomonoides exilis]|eukprot:MONOS_3642.1-p1 / transcript=MONOS_3642.1 / gene=MONOS_3642 / organism=Monocercomonoides_exilis_PA203 / gene_product=unspecified product / transcript_product=unspecified product / location=Mono_scaffold00087:85474-90501(+) / protein_length=1652 / sequence_SO=supercontig / SO=protein_coding / is_pseudo=false
MFVVGIAILISAFVADDDCTFKFGGLYDKDRIAQCLKHLPYKKGEGETLETMKTVRSYIDSYAYRDTMVNPPEPFSGFDIVTELDKIENTEYKNGLEYHLAISRAFNKLEDAHTNYVFPCSTLFTFIFPFRFVFEVPDPSKPKEIVVKVAGSILGDATNKFIKEGGVNIIDKEVVRLDLPDLEGSGNEKPEVAIAKWADKYSIHSRTSAAKLAFSITEEVFFQRSLVAFPIPNGNIGVTVKTAEGEQKVDVPFYAYSLANVTDVDEMLTKICPLKEKMQRSNTSKQASAKTPLFEEDEKHFRSVMDAHKDDPLFQQIYEGIWKSPELKKALSQNSGNIPINERLRLPIEKEIFDRVDKIISKQFASRNEISQNDNQKQTFKEKVEEKIRKMKKNGDSFTNLRYSNNEKPQLKVIKKATRVFAAAIEEYKLGYLFIGTFSPSTNAEASEWLSCIVEGITYAKAHGFKLVVDLRTNAGGLILLSDWLFALLFPEEYPIYPTRSVVASELSKAYLKTVEQPPFAYLTEPITQKIIDDEWAMPKTTVTITGNDGKQRSQDWVYKYVADTDRLVQQLMLIVPLPFRNVRMFAPSDVLFVTDGTCGSACSQFLKRLKEKNLGRVVGLGGSLSGSTVPFDIASFNSGNAIGSDFVEQLRPKSEAMNGKAEFKNLTNENVFPYPGKLPRLTSDIRMTLSTAYSFDWSTPDEEPEFKIVQPDEIIPIYADLVNSFSVEGIVDTVTQIKPIFDKCYDWEVKDNYACQIPANNKHEVYGNPCVGGKFDKDQCKFSRCERGFYADKDGNCQKRPSMGPAKYQEDPTVCVFPQMVPGRADRIIDCLKQLPYDKTEATKTLKTLREYLSVYAYRDTTADPPKPFENNKYDILGELDKIEEAEFSSGLDFHNAIGKAFAKLKDAHTIYHFPCSQPFAFMLPYSFKFEVSDPSKPEEITVKLAEMLPFVTNYYVNDIGRSFKDRIVTKITMSDFNEVENEKPEVTIARWCDENVPLSRTPAARLNYGLDQMFFIRSPTYNTIVDVSVNVTLKTEDGGTETIPLYWYGVSTSNITGSQMLYGDYCKADGSASNDEAEWKATNNEERQQLQRLIQSTKMPQEKLIEEYKSLVQMSKDQLKKQDEERIQKIREEYANNTQFVKAFEKFMENKPLRELIAKDRILHQPLQQLLPPAVQSLQRMIEKENLRMAGKSKMEQSHLANEVEVKEIGTLLGSIHAVAIPEWKIGYCHIRSFSPQTEEDFVKFMDILVKVVQEAKENNYKMVFDVRNNGGGIIYLGAQLFHFLFPEEYPINPRYNYVRSNATDYIAKMMADRKYLIFTDYETMDFIDDVTNLPTSEKKTNIGGKERTQTWSGSYAINSDRLLYEYIGSNIPSSLYGKNLFDPNDLMFITDGECGSTCSQFLKHVKEAQLAKVIGIGGQLTHKDIDYDIASFAAGNVISSEAIDVYRDEVNSIEGWPSKFPRSGTQMTFAMMTSYSFDWKKSDEQLEYKIVKPDEVYPFYPSIEVQLDPDSYISLVEKVKKYFDVCYDWQVKVNESCAVPGEDANAVYGNPCKQGKFTSECAFARCANGYYRNKEDKCVKYPVMPPLPKEEDKPAKKRLSGGAIAGIVVGSVAVVGVAVAIAVVCIVRQKKKKTRKDDYLNMKLTENSN